MHSSKKNALLGLKEISKWLIICVYNEEKIYLFNFAIARKINATENLGQIHPHFVYHLQTGAVKNRYKMASLRQ